MMFGVAGIADVAFENGWDLSFEVALQSDGKIIVVGYADGPETEKARFGIVRYNDDGSRDSSFGTGGLTSVDFVDGNGSAHGLVIDSMGRILVGGGAGGLGVRSGLARLTTDGLLDDSFGSSGRVVSSAPEFKKLVVSGEGKIVAVGWNTMGVSLARFEAVGSVDASFGSNGISVAASSSLDNQANDLAIQPDQRIVVVGTRLDPPDEAGPRMDFVAARFCP